MSELCTQLGITHVTLYRYVGPQGQLREQGEKVDAVPERQVGRCAAPDIEPVNRAEAIVFFFAPRPIKWLDGFQYGL